MVNPANGGTPSPAQSPGSSTVLEDQGFYFRINTAQNLLMAAMLFNMGNILFDISSYNDTIP